MFNLNFYFPSAEAIFKTVPGRFRQAEELLNNLAEEGDLTSSDGLFRAVQMINLQRLSEAGAAFTLSADQISTLEQVAAKSAPESSYARALLGLLLDRQFWPGYQVPFEVELPETEANNTTPGLSIAPNPSSGAFTLDLGKYYPEPILIEIRDLAGRSIQSLEFQEGQRFEVDLNGQLQVLSLQGQQLHTLNLAGEISRVKLSLPAGIYLVAVAPASGAAPLRQKVVLR